MILRPLNKNQDHKLSLKAKAGMASLPAAQVKIHERPEPVGCDTL